MAQSTSRARVVGDYIIGRQIGSGSFSVVWHAKHRESGMEFAIKEIAMNRLSKKLQESLMSEIVILRNINHRNIIRLHDIIEAPTRVNLVLDYCRGGDLSVYIQNHGRVPEATAKYFMSQLADGLQVLRRNNLIHRDLKPQNLLLSTNDDNAILKIADFGFARSLQPRGLAETLCGSPLYMAPEIMQFQKYDAKADLWSVGTILFQLVTGRTPFTGNSQLQLLHNITKSNELRFPSDCKDLSSECFDLCQKLLRRDPVQRLTFEEFFNHQFFTRNQSCGSSSRMASRPTYGFSPAESSAEKHKGESSQDECLIPVSNDDPSNPYKSQSLPVVENSFKHHHRSSTVVDSLEEFIDREYVLVSGPPLDASSSSGGESRLLHAPSKPDGSMVVAELKSSAVSAPVPIIGAGINNAYGFGSLGSHSSVPSGTSQGSTDMGDPLDQPPAHSFMRIRSLQQFACAIKELVTEKTASGRKLEAFSIQLVILAIWKQALDIFHTLAASASDVISTPETVRVRGSINKKHCNPSIQECYSVMDGQGPDAICSHIEKEFLLEVGFAEDLSKCLEPFDVGAAMPDAMETIFQSALGLGRRAAVKEMMGDMENSACLYSKAVCLLRFLLAEAPSLIMNPPFSLTSSDRYRLSTYIDLLNNRESQTRSQRMALLKCEDQLCTP